MDRRARDTWMEGGCGMKGNRATPRPRNARTDSTTAGLTSGRVRLSGAPQLKLMSVCIIMHVWDILTSKSTQMALTGMVQGVGLRGSRELQRLHPIRTPLQYPRGVNQHLGDGSLR